MIIGKTPKLHPVSTIDETLGANEDSTTKGFVCMNIISIISFLINELSAS